MSFYSSHIIFMYFCAKHIQLLELVMFQCCSYIFLFILYYLHLFFVLNISSYLCQLCPNIVHTSFYSFHIIFIFFVLNISSYLCQLCPNIVHPSFYSSHLIFVYFCDKHLCICFNLLCVINIVLSTDNVFFSKHDNRVIIGKKD